MLPVYTKKKHPPCNKGKGLQRWMRWTGVVLFAIYLLPSVSHAQPNIIRVEHYLDIDPGFGNATAIGITPSTDIQNVVVTIDPATLSIGVHRLFVRAMDANGSWSMANTWLFYKPYPVPGAPPAPVLAKMSKLEYYFDTDPGYGNGIPVALDTTLTDFADYVVPINVTGLAAGSHTFWVRGLDKDGKWSMMNDYTFTMPAHLPIPAIVVNSVTHTINCARDSFEVSYDITGAYNAGNVFNVELSDASGSFASPIIIGSYAGTGNAIVKVKLPSHLPDGTNYKIRVSSTNPVVTGTTNTIAVTIHDRPVAQTITGATDANAGFPYIYSVPYFAGSTWVWLAPAASITQNNDSASLVWNTAAQPQTIQVIETNQYGCTGDTSSVTVTIYKLRIGIIAPVTACKAFAITINANADGAFGSGNTITAQLSDATGSFAAPVSIGSVPLVGNGLNQPAVINASIPANIPNGTNYRVRLISSTGPFVGDTSVAISIVKPDIGADSTVYHTCLGETTNLLPLYNTTGLTAVWDTADTTAAPPGIYRLVVTNTFGCMDTAFANIVLEVATWNGSVSNNWHTAENWSINKVPALKTHVIIPSGTLNPCFISTADGEAASVQSKPGAVLQVASNRKLLVAQKCLSLPAN